MLINSSFTLDSTLTVRASKTIKYVHCEATVNNCLGHQLSTVIDNISECCLIKLSLKQHKR